MKLCKCGCGQVCNNLFISGHNARVVTEETKKKRLETKNKNNYKPTQETRKKMSLAILNRKICLGYVNSFETRKKMSLAKKGKLSPRKNKTFEEIYGIEKAKQIKEKMSSNLKGKHLSFATEFKKGMTPCNKGVPMSKEQKNKLKLYNGQIPWNKNRIGIYSESTIFKIKEARLNQVFPSKDTKIEIAMQNRLTKENIFFVTHFPILGQPDIFIDPNICIFCDGDYWHKFPNGTERDKIVSEELRKKGYVVLRFWERDIHKNIDLCFEQINNIKRGGMK